MDGNLNDFLKLDEKLFDLLPTAVYACDASGLITHYNRRAAELWGREPRIGEPDERFCGSLRLYRMDGSHMPHEQTPMAEVLRSGVAQHGIEAIFERPDGSRIIVLVNIVPIHDDNGVLIGAVNAFQDITDRKRVEQENKRLAAVVNSSDDAIISKTLDGTIVSWNVGAERLYGYTEQEVIGKPISILIPPDHEDELFSILERIKRGERVDHYETVRVCKDGSRRNVSLRISPVHDANGRIVGASKIARDITMQKAAEDALQKSYQRLQLLSDTISTLVLNDNPQAFIDELFENLSTQLDLDVYFNYLLGEEPQSLQLHCYRGISDQSVEKLKQLKLGQAIWRTSAEKQCPVIVSNLQESDDPEARFLQDEGITAYACYPLLSHEKLVGVLSFGTRTRLRFDPDELALMQTVCDHIAIAVERSSLLRELQQNSEQLAEAAQRKDEFLAMLAHELRNPLAPIRSGLEILNIAGENREIVGLMQEQVDHLVRLVDDLLDVSRIMRGRIDLRMTPMELKTAVTRAIDIAKPAIESQGHTLTVDLPPEPLWIRADSVRLAQVIANLLHNSAKYTEQHGRIWLTGEQDGNGVVLRVRDNGIGLDADLMPKIFDLFTQGDRSIDRSHGGLGIGLTLVHSLVEMHHGTITAFSDGQGKGSEFVIRLPALSHYEAQPSSNDNEEALVSRRRVLVVDDNIPAARMLKLLMEKFWKHEVQVVHDGEAALEAAKNWRPDVVLLDIGLPKMNGYEVATHLRKDSTAPNMLLVALTGYGQEKDRLRSLEAGIDEHLVKPPSMEALRKLFSRERPLQMESDGAPGNGLADFS